MIAVTLEYRPYGFLWKRRLEKQLPDKWNELNCHQIIAIPKLQEGKLDEFRLLQIFLGIERSIAKRLSSYQRFSIIRNIKILQNLQPIGRFIIKKVVGFKAPKNNLEGITFGAFILGDTYYQNYIEGKKDDLDKFIACFYYNRFCFSDKHLERNARIIGLADISIRQAIAINYALIREWLTEVYPYVFQKGEPEKKRNSSKGWVGVFDAIVRDDIVNQDKYLQQPVSVMFRYINNRILENIKNGSKV
jgi:hypothetical protein